MRLRANRIFPWLLLAGCCLLVLSGCGYTTNVALPKDIKTMHVEIFKNNIGITKEVSAKDKYEAYRPNLEVDLRDAIIERLFLDGHLKVSAKAYADAVLEGEIIQYRKDPLRYQNEDVREYRINLVCDIRLRSSKDSEILLEQKSLAGDTTYFTTGSLQKSEGQALKDSASDLARLIVNKIVENW
ncbi:LPS assembly lipoprotein LptE [Candidatus Omnitrophota bacterium]